MRVAKAALRPSLEVPYRAPPNAPDTRVLFAVTLTPDSSASLRYASIRKFPRQNLRGRLSLLGKHADLGCCGQPSGRLGTHCA